VKRKHGQASVEEHPKGSGRFRVRARVGGSLRTLASGMSRPEAEEAAAAYTVTRNEAAITEGVTLAAFGTGFLARRGRAGIRGISGDRSKWSKNIERDPIGGMAVATLERRDVLEWLDRRVHLAHRTRIRLLNLLRVALAEAVDRGLLAANPARDVKVHRASSARSVDDLEGVLLPAEQQALIAAVPDRDRALVVFALCTGLRQAEQWWLHWTDLAEDRIVVRRSTGGLPPKGGKPREVYLLPPALAALETVPHRRAPFVFPATRGGRRQEAKAPRHWKRWLAAAGITRRVRWHDLRHTCATSLLAGWWGRKWSLDEVCRFMGHSSVSVTERYARKLNETQALAVAATPGPLFPQGNGSGGNSPMLQDKASAFLKPRSQVRFLPGAQRDSRSGWEHKGNKGEFVPATVDALRRAAESVFARAGVAP
jgi:integrase